MTTVDDHELAEELREHFERRAASSVPPPLPVAGLRREVRRDRARRIGLAVTAVAAAALAVGGGMQLLPAAAPATVTPAGEWAGLRLATAGDLARDDTWLTAARARADGFLDGPIAHVVFAGRLPVGAALVVVTGPRSQAVSFYSPTGAAADLGLPEMTSRTQFDGPGDDVSVAVTAPDGSRLFAVVPIRGRRVEVSPGVRLGRSGELVRSWTEVPLRDGAAVGRFAATDVQTPRSRVDGGRAVQFLDSQVATPGPVRRELTRLFGPSWTIGPAPDENLFSNALWALADAVDLRTVDLEPVFHGREQPSNSDVLAAVVHLPSGGAIQVVSTFDDRKPDELVSSTPLAGRPVPSGRVPIGWLDDISTNADGGTHARARVVFRGAARVVLRDTGATPCAPGRQTFGSATPDPGGLATMVVDLPLSCLDPAPKDVDVFWGFGRIQAIAYDAGGRELGRGPIALQGDTYAPGAAPGS